MEYKDIIESELEKNIIYLEEGISFSPFLAYSVFKDDFFKKSKKVAGKLPKKVEKALKKTEAKGKIFKEKARETFGVNTGGTVYKLTPEQEEVIKDIYRKYGNSVVKEIRDFRRNVLAPYNLIKRYVKDNQKISSKDITGMTKEQFQSALESGRKKIEARGENYKEKSKQLQKKILRYNSQISNLRTAKKEIENGNIHQGVLKKLYSIFEVGDKDLQGYSPEELKRISDSIIRNTKDLEHLSKNDLDLDSIQKGRELLQNQKELRAGKGIDLTKTNKDKFYRHGNFNVALGKYFLRKNIIDKVKLDSNSEYRRTYISIIDELIKSLAEKKKNALDELVSLKRTTEFNEREKKIWEKRPTVDYDSNKISDYYQKIKEEDFLNKTINIPKNDKIIKAEKEIDKEIKKFEKRLLKTVSKEDVAKLKRYRLINNFISVKELSNPENLFKSEKEIDKLSTEKKSEKGYITTDEYIRRIKDIASREYDSISELNKAKQEAEDLSKTMREEGEDEVVDKMSDILRQIKERRELKKREIIGHKTDSNIIVGIKDIENFINKMLKTDYKDDFDKQKQDKSILNKMIEDYKKSDPDYKENMYEIEDLLDKLDMKLRRGNSYE